MARTASVRRATPSREKAWLREAVRSRTRAVMTHQRCRTRPHFSGNAHAHGERGRGKEGIPEKYGLVHDQRVRIYITIRAGMAKSSSRW